MRSIKQEQRKYELHKELQLRYREFFESKLAVDLLKCSKNFFAVKKISIAIAKLIISNKEIVENEISNNPKIIAELREPYFGSCYDTQETVTAKEALNKILSILTAENPDLSKVMQIHCIFSYRIYDLLEKIDEKAEFASQLFPDCLFNNKSRSRTENNNIESTHKLGITKHTVFTKMLGKSDKKHLRALDKYKYSLDCNSTFFKSIEGKATPIVCGPSGHTGSLILGAKLYGNLTADELKEYACACFAFLAAGGNHSFYEVMVVANLAGINISDYSSSISAAIKTTDIYKNLSCRFTEFLNPEVQSKERQRLLTNTVTVQRLPLT